MNIQNKKAVLVTYDCGNLFDINKFVPIQNFIHHIKPRGGLWSSPIDSAYGWKDWCTEEDYRSLSSSFTFSFTGIFLVIDSEKDLEKIPEMAKPVYQTTFKYMDFERLKTMGIDAIHLTKIGEEQTRNSVPGLYGWDCESVLILNPFKVL